MHKGCVEFCLERRHIGMGAGQMVAGLHEVSLKGIEFSVQAIKIGSSLGQRSFDFETDALLHIAFAMELVALRNQTLNFGTQCQQAN